MSHAVFNTVPVYSREVVAARCIPPTKYATFANDRIFLRHNVPRRHPPRGVKQRDAPDMIGSEELQIPLPPNTTNRFVIPVTSKLHQFQTGAKSFNFPWLSTSKTSFDPNNVVPEARLLDRWTSRPRCSWFLVRSKGMQGIGKLSWNC